MMRILGFVLAISLTLGLAPRAIAQQAATAPAAKPSKPVDIESDRMQINDKEKWAVFTGNVVAKRPDVTLTCDSLKVVYAEEKQADGTTKNEVTQLEATGHVVIVTDDEKITGDWAKMNPETDDLEVGGNVTLAQGETVLRGERLQANLDTDKLEMTGGRVKGSFLPK
jgi:lipopolysaccharide export system protein LptA